MKLKLREGKSVAWRHSAEGEGPGRTPTSSPFSQVAVGGGSPVMATSSRSLFPATTTMELSEVFPEQSRWIFGGSRGTKEALGTWPPNTITGAPEKQPQPPPSGVSHPGAALALTLLGNVLYFDFWKDKEMEG